jgi:hypothetical protein
MELANKYKVRFKGENAEAVLERKDGKFVVSIKSDKYRANIPAHSFDHGAIIAQEVTESYQNV